MSDFFANVAGCELVKGEGTEYFECKGCIWCTSLQ